MQKSLEQILLPIEKDLKTFEKGLKEVFDDGDYLVNKIAKSSEQQSENITQVNKGIDQVAQVVQQNSATAQESAAASQEMRGQSEVLEQLLSQFKLKNDNSSYRLPPSSGY